jgi:hypothetical protein
MSGGYGENEGREEVKGGLVPYEDNISDEVILFNNFSVLGTGKIWTIFDNCQFTLPLFRSPFS